MARKIESLVLMTNITHLPSAINLKTTLIIILTKRLSQVKMILMKEITWNKTKISSKLLRHYILSTSWISLKRTSKHSTTVKGLINHQFRVINRVKASLRSTQSKESPITGPEKRMMSSLAITNNWRGTGLPFLRC